MTNTTKRKVANTASPVTGVARRQIKDTTKLRLFVVAGGRCEFDGCNQYLMDHHLTHDHGNFGEMAHIVAFQPEGPRGTNAARPVDINEPDNLMFLCPQCHKLIDDHPDEYTRETLQKYKQAHEDRIFRLTATMPDRKTTIVQLKCKIGGHTVAIPVADVKEAVSPRYPDDPRGFVIDLTNIHGDDAAFIETAKQTIKREIDRLYAPGMEVETTRHISLFALAPIPLLIYLGSQLSNKVPVDVYQRHRDTEDWTWKTDGGPVGYAMRPLQAGTDHSKVALILSLSGSITLADLPGDIDQAFSVYEITLAQATPSPTYLRLAQELIGFKDIYQQTLRTIAREHGKLESIHLFPAVPAPIAVLCGRELLPKVDPTLLVYDNDKRKGGFNLTIGVNTP